MIIILKFSFWNLRFGDMFRGSLIVIILGCVKLEFFFDELEFNIIFVKVLIVFGKFNI